MILEALMLSQSASRTAHLSWRIPCGHGESLVRQSSELKLHSVYSAIDIPNWVLDVE
jgi:hypothetical protein